METKVRSALNLNENLQSELDKVRNEQATNERELRSQIDTMASRAQGETEWRSRYEGLDRSHQDLRSELSRQEKLTNEVRQEASGFISQMKSFSERTTQSVEREEKLVVQVQKLESELNEWKNRYARVKTQARSARSLSTGVPIHSADARTMTKDLSFLTPEGLIKDIHVTRFQIAIDELLQSARSAESIAVLPHIKTVVIAIKNITMDVGDTQTSQDEATQQKQKLKLRVSATANNLITAAKNFAMSNGLSPVSLLDAAASHLSASIIELVRTVKMHPSSIADLDDDANSDIVDSPADYYGLMNGRTSTGGDSTYSIESKPQLTSRAFSGSRKPVVNGVPNGAPQKKASVSSITRDIKIEELKVGSSRVLSVRLNWDANTALTRTSWIPAQIAYEQHFKHSSPLSAHLANLQISLTPLPPSPLLPARSSIKPLVLFLRTQNLAASPTRLRNLLRSSKRRGERVSR